MRASFAQPEDAVEIESDAADRGSPPDRGKKWTGDVPMKSLVVKRSVAVAGHKTSISLEHDFWSALKDIARDRALTVSELVAIIDDDRKFGNLSSAARLFVLDYFRMKSPAAQAPREASQHRPAA
jgi:predicted DNA-binding ribbon-helix-helix protein